jgi:hypothetical protein
MNGFENYNIGEWVVGGLTRHVDALAHSVRNRVGSSAVKTVFALVMVGATLTATLPSEAPVTNIAFFAADDSTTPQPSLRLITGSAPEYWGRATSKVASWKHAELVDGNESLPEPFV